MEDYKTTVDALGITGEYKLSQLGQYMFGHLRMCGVVLAISASLAGCATTDEDYMNVANRAIPVVVEDGLKATGGIDAYEILGPIEYSTSVYPNDMTSRQMMMFHYMADDAKRKYPQAEAVLITHFGTIPAGSFAIGSAIRKEN